MWADAVRVMKTAMNCCFVLCLAGCWGRVTLGADRADPETISAAQELVRAVGVRWDESVFDASVAPNFYKQVKRSDVAAFLGTVRSKLGTLKSIKVIQSDETQSDGSNGETMAADFLFDATFAKGRGQISATLVDDDGALLFQSLHVVSPLLKR